MLKTKILLSVIALALVSCSSDGTDTTSIPTLDVIISSTGATTTIDEKDGYNLLIIGDNNTITIAKYNYINLLTLSGSNNMITFERINTVETFNVSGNDNTIFIDGNVTTSISITTDTGAGNQIIIQ